ncbi:unnamed protein product, partial [Didymodactylos carnosus]
HCLLCQLRKPLKQPVVSKPIISLGVMTRLQIDLIDMRTRPDVVSVDVVYCWILHCIDHFSKFTWAYPLENKSAKEVVVHNTLVSRFIACSFYGINTRTSDTTKATPYEIMFGQHPRGDSEFWKIVKH